MPLTPKQERFVTEYLVDLNATHAALWAGYSPRTAPQQGSRLLKNVHVQAATAPSADACFMTSSWVVGSRGPVFWWN